MVAPRSISRSWLALAEARTDPVAASWTSTCTGKVYASLADLAAASSPGQWSGGTSWVYLCGAGRGVMMGKERERVMMGKEEY